MYLALPLGAQNTPQRHQTAALTLSNGTIDVWSVDRGGARTVYVDARALTVDSLLGRPRGGTWAGPAAAVPAIADQIVAAVVAVPTGDTLSIMSSRGFVRTATIRCLATGCTLTVTNHTPAGAVRAGSWTTSRLTLAQMLELAAALREAALHQTGAVFVWPR